MLIVTGGMAVGAEEGGAEHRVPAPLVVFDFEGGPGGSTGMGRAVADMLITELGKSGRFRVFERSRLEEVFREQKLGMDMGGKMEAVKTVGASVAVMGKITEYGVTDQEVRVPARGTVTRFRARVALDARAVLVDDGRVLKSWSAVGAKSSFKLGINVLGIPDFDYTSPGFQDTLLGKATRQAADEIAGMVTGDLSAAKMMELMGAAALRGLVADVDGSDVVINIGEDAGVAAGDVFRVTRVVREIRDPATGEVLKTGRRRVGEIIVTHVEQKYADASVLERVEGEEIMVNDIVEEEGGGGGGR
ncbi:MAG: CsgG/HfaB family protein [bacterium]